MVQSTLSIRQLESWVLLGFLAPVVWSIIGESPLSGLERLLDK